MFKLARYNAAMNRFYQALMLSKEEMVLFVVMIFILMFISSIGIYYFENVTISVMQYYADYIIKEDLRTGDHNSSFKRWVVKYGPDLLPDNEQFSQHIIHLNKFKNIYDNYSWAKHMKANKSVYYDYIDLVTKYEKRFIQSLSEICRAEWQQEKIRVDISFNSKRDIPYTTTKPVTHIIMDSQRSVVADGEWFELLLHEASHHLINSKTGFIGGTILNTAETLKLEPPRQLWHSYLFYFSGKVSQAILVEEGFSDYQMYMVKYGVFGWIFPFLDRQLPAYLNGEISLNHATSRIIIEFSESR